MFLIGQNFVTLRAVWQVLIEVCRLFLNEVLDGNQFLFTTQKYQKYSLLISVLLKLTNSRSPKIGITL